MNKNDSCAKLVHTNSLHGNCHIFLDTHPNNCEAAKRLKEAQKKAAELTEKYESQFGPINETSRDTSRWAWITGPWPWEVEANE